MRSRLLTLLLGVVMSSTTLAAGDPSAPFNSPRLLKFKSSIGFDQSLAAEKKNEIVDVDWMKLPTPPALHGWKEITRELNPERANGSRSFSWQFEKENQLLTITVEVFSATKNEASTQFLLHADASTMMELPWVRGPSTLGTIAAMSKLTPPSTVFWIYRNVFAEVSPSSKATVSALEISSWLQGQMEGQTRAISK